MHRLEARRKLMSIRIGEFAELASELEKRRVDQVGELREEFLKLGAAKFEDVYGDAEREILAVYPQILRRSMFLLLYGLVESDLVEFCRKELEPRFDRKLSEFRDQGLKLVNAYVRKVAGVEGIIEVLGTEEQTLLGKIRNKLIHGYGLVDEDEEKKLLDLVSKYRVYQYEVVVMSNSIHLGTKLIDKVASRFRTVVDTFYESMIESKLLD